MEDGRNVSAGGARMQDEKGKVVVKYVSAGGARFVTLEDVGLLSRRLKKLKVNPKPVLFGANAVRNLQR